MTGEHTEEEHSPEEQTSNGEAAEEAQPTGVPLSPLSKAIGALVEGQRAAQDRLLRTAADFENFKKRSRKENSEGAQRAENRVVTAFLPVLDNLQRALAHTNAEREGLMEGVKMVNKQFLGTMERFDIKPFPSRGEVFNPERHEAIQQIHSDQPAGTICEELEVGYLRGERLVRPSRVIISLGPAKDPEQGEEGNQDSAAPEVDPGSEGEPEAN